MKNLVVIPARLASSRLAEKILLQDTGKYLVQHVYEQAKKASLVDDVIIATDHQKIEDAVNSFGGNVCMTDINHQSGTDRIAEVSSKFSAEIYINVQGDEPEIQPEAIDCVAQLLADNEAHVATLAFPISKEEAQNPNQVKVVLDKDGYALYFSRAMIPYPRDNDSDITYWGHMGIYAYRKEFLDEYHSLAVSSLEKAEKLEQLRVLENGYKIIVAKTNFRTRGIDTIDDYKMFVERYQKNAVS